MIHQTFRSLDEPPKLVGFTLRQWLALIVDAAAVFGLVQLTHLPTKPSITLFVFTVGLPAALMYVSESGGLRLDRLLLDFVGWRSRRNTLAAVSSASRKPCGLLVLGTPVSHSREGVDAQQLDNTLADLLADERWES